MAGLIYYGYNVNKIRCNEMKMKKIISIFTNIVLVASIFAPNFSRAEWIDFDAASKASDAMDKILDRQEEIYNSLEDRYGIDQDIYRKAKRKVSAPRVDIFFDNTNPKAGEKVTAHAIPEFFKNDPPNLYYTWYIIHTKNGSIQTATNSIDAGIREASKIMAPGGYEPELGGEKTEKPTTESFRRKLSISKTQKETRKNGK